MSSISARVLELLALLQSRRHWSGAELARRLDVSPRTLRRDVESLQQLGYPIATARGTGGGYQLAPGGSLPPLALSEDEAAAVVIALKEVVAGGYPAGADAAVSALAKIVQVFPAKIRRRLDALRHLSTLPGPYGPPAIVDAAVLTTLALASRDHETLTFHYTDVNGVATKRQAQPHHIVSLDRRLYLIAYDLTRGDWRTFRIDRVTNPQLTRRTFAPRELPINNPAEYVRTQINNAGIVYEVTATVHASAEQVQAHLGDWGTATPLKDSSCSLLMRASNLDWAAFSLAALNAPFTVHGPPEAVRHVARWGFRLTAAVAEHASG